MTDFDWLYDMPTRAEYLADLDKLVEKGAMTATDTKFGRVYRFPKFDPEDVATIHPDDLFKIRRT